MELDESDSIAPLGESLPLMPSDDEEQRYWNMRSIYRVPAHITTLNHEAYRPQVVSFGPYHHGEDQLLPMEEHKCRAVRHFLKRSKKPIERFFESLREVVGDLEESYDALDPKWKVGSGEDAASLFLELMITDGCFMLEILRVAANEVDDYAPHDPIFSSHGHLFMMPCIEQDMLILENQLPMLVLERLVAVESDGKKGAEFINELILNSYNLSKGIARMGKYLHVLDALRKCMLMELEEDKGEWEYSPGSIPFSPGTIQLASATELREHGIRFKKSKTDSLKDISFVGGVLTLPRIWVDVKTMSRFLNLMAFERLHVGAGNKVMSYIYCMDHIISNGQDVRLLRAKGIIVNFLESDEAVANMFDSLGKVVRIHPSRSLNDVLEKVNKYYNKRWNMWRANLIRTYFRNPWVALSLIAAVFLFALTTIQTVYSVLGSHK